jgi:hypothetical protein
MKGGQRRTFEVTYAGVSIGLSHGKIVPMDRFLSYSKKTQEYILGLLALTNPDQVIKFYLSYPVKSSNDKKILYLAQQISTGEREPKLGPRLRAMLSDMVKGASTKGDEETPSEKGFKSITYPNLSMALKKFDTLAQDAVKKVRSLRTQVGKDLVSRRPYVQIRILSSALEAEEKVAGFLVEAPVPSDLTPEQAEEYRKGFSSLAQEFTTQSQEYLKVKKSLEEQLDLEAKNHLPVPDLGQWGWPGGQVEVLLSGVKTLADQDAPLAALFVLDQIKTANEIPDKDYYQARARILFSLKTHDAMGEYVLGELNQANQTELVEKWKKIKEAGT